MTVTEFLEKQSKRILVPLGLLLLAGVGVADALVHTPLLQLSIFYLLPISFFAWFIGSGWGLLVAFASAAWVLRIHQLRMPGLAPYWDSAIWLAVYLGALAIIREVRILYVRERDLSHVDPLTRMPNRRAFFEFAEVETSRARRNGEPLTLGYFDIDGFKQINDKLGHAAGDAMLAEVARTTQSCLRRGDIAARMGGDEFAILLPQTDAGTAERILGRVHALLRTAMQKHGWPATFSIGVATFRGAVEIDEMVSTADQMMYAAKNGGKNRLESRDFAA